MSVKTPEPPSDNQDEEVYFRFGASLRITGDGLDFDQITNTLGISPSLLALFAELEIPFGVSVITV